MKAKKAIENGLIGEILKVNVDWTFLSYDLMNHIKSWKTDVKQGGGALSFYFSHTFYYLEYFLDLKPCILCIYQRIPYFIIIFLAIILFFIKNNKLEKKFYFLYAIIFLSSLFLAVYHFGIENNFWSAFASCEINDSLLNDNQNLKEYLLEKEFVSCSKVNFTLFGISLAGYNIIISLFLLILSLLKLKKNYI